jgi:DNA-binding MarR family transcriptional regulator
MKNTIRQDEWQVAYEKAMKGDPGESVGEVAKRIGTTPGSAKSWLKRMVREGKAVKGEALRGGRVREVYQLRGTR